MKGCCKLPQFPPLLCNESWNNSSPCSSVFRVWVSSKRLRKAHEPRKGSFQSSCPAEVRKWNFSPFFSAKDVVKFGVKFWWNFLRYVFQGLDARRKISPKFHIKNGVKNGKFHANFTLPGRSAESLEGVLFLQEYTPLLAVALWLPNVLLGPMPLGRFCFLGVTLDSAKGPCAKTTFSWLLTSCPQCLCLTGLYFIAQQTHLANFSRFLAHVGQVYQLSPFLPILDEETPKFFGKIKGAEFALSQHASWVVALGLVFLGEHKRTRTENLLTSYRSHPGRVSEPPKRGRKTGAARKLSKNVEKYFDTFWRFLTFFALREKCRKVSKIFLPLFDVAPFR